MTPLWTGEDVIAAVGSSGAEDWHASGISIDAATTQPGDLFIALHGRVDLAFANGAVAAIVTQIDQSLPQPQIIVADPMAALADLARAARFRSRAKLVAVTGSMGKASTIGMLRVILGGQGVCHAPDLPGKTRLMVPLCLATLPQAAEFAVIKFGADQPGEIGPLARLVQPHAAIVTGVGAVHLRDFRTMDAITAEKSAIFQGLAPGGAALFQGDGTYAAQLRAMTGQAQVTSYGGPGQDWVLGQVRLGRDVTVVMAKGMGQDYLFKLGTSGAHFAMNAIGALAAATALGADPVTATLDLAQWVPAAGRGTCEDIVLDPARDGETLRLIDETANANPTSVATALAVIAASSPADNVGRIVKGRRIAIMGDMGALGAQSAQAHRDLAGNSHLQTLDQIHCIGPQIYHLWRILPQHQRGQWAQTAAELAPHVSKLVDAGDVVLVKGAASSKTALVVDAIRKLGHRRPHEE